MAKKITLIFSVGTLITALMFFSLVSEKKDVLIIGDSLVMEDNNFSEQFVDYLSKEVNTVNTDYTSLNLYARNFYDIMQFNEKYENNEYTILQLINKADIIIISIGTDEITNNENVKLYLYYMDKILNKISSINNKLIYVSGIYLDNALANNINYEIKNLCKKYDFIYVDILKENAGNLLIENYINLSNKP